VRASRSEQGFTLIELILALTLVAALLAITFGGLRVGLASWRQGEDRSEVQQHARSLVQVLARTVAGAAAYQGEPKEGAAPVLLFEGERERVAFVTATPPFPPAVPIAFTAVILSVERGEKRGLSVRQKPLPNTEPFAVAAPAFVDDSVEAIRFRYLKDAASWEDAWAVDKEKTLPRAVEITVTSIVHGRSAEHVITVPIPVASP
jgi:general secretion pathway protein J